MRQALHRLWSRRLGRSQISADTGYRASDYWEERLSARPSLRGTGLVSHSRSFNEWLYRRKAQVLRSALRGVKPGSRALDAGCGIGWGTRELLAIGAVVDACDITDTAVRAVGDLGDVTAFQHELGAAPIPRPDDTFAVAIAIDVLYHVVDDAAWEEAVADLARVLAPGGRLIVTDAFAPDDVDLADHVRMRSRDRWTALAEELGLVMRDDLPLLRWLAREPFGLARRLTPGFALGPLEHALEQLAPEPAHTRCVSYKKVGSFG